MVTVNKFPAIAAALRPAVKQIVHKAAFSIQGYAVANAPRDTDFMASAIYVVTSDSSGYGNVGTPPGDSYLLPQVPAPSDDTTAIVACGANYSIYVNCGTRFMAAQPFFDSAVDQGAADFAQVAAAFEQMLGAA